LVDIFLNNIVKLKGQGGLRSYILNKITDTSSLALLSIGKKNIILPAKYIKNLLNYHFNLFHTKIRAGKRIGPHHNDVISVIVSSLLGDCYANKRSIEGTRFSYRQSIVHKDYLFWLYFFL
jgi:hypothetical protein